jgi:predicted nucleotidyltransferase
MRDSEMHPDIEAKKPEILSLCQKYGVVRLDLFGSATGPNWDPEKSDFDFVIEFADYGPGISSRFFDFGDDLEDLLARKVDFVFEERLRPRFRARVDASRVVVVR